MQEKLISQKMSDLETLNYIKDNVDETLDFAHRCSKKSIKRFIFVSSIKSEWRINQFRNSFQGN